MMATPIEHLTESEWPNSRTSFKAPGHISRSSAVVKAMLPAGLQLSAYVEVEAIARAMKFQRRLSDRWEVKNIASYRSLVLDPIGACATLRPGFAHEGRRPEAVLKVERGLASRDHGRTTGSGGFGNRSPGTTTRAARSWLHVLRRKWRGRKRGPEAQNRQSGAPRGERPRSQGGAGASQAPGVPRFWHAGGASQAPPRLSALRFPSRRGSGP